MNRRLLIVAAALTITAFGVAPSRAMTGGPDLCEVLGYDPRDEKVFVAIYHADESGRLPTVLYFELRASFPEVPRVVGWSRGSLPDTTRHGHELRKLKRRLRPMIQILWPSFVVTRIMERRDTTIRTGETTFVYHIDVPYQVGLWNQSLQVTAFRDSTVRLLSLYTVPGRRERLAVVSFMGIPYEGGFEVQAPALVRGRSHVVRWEQYQ